MSPSASATRLRHALELVQPARIPGDELDRLGCARVARLDDEAAGRDRVLELRHGYVIRRAAAPASCERLREARNALLDHLVRRGQADAEPARHLDDRARQHEHLVAGQDLRERLVVRESVSAP